MERVTSTDPEQRSLAARLAIGIPARSIGGYAMHMVTQTSLEIIDWNTAINGLERVYDGPGGIAIASLVLAGALEAVRRNSSGIANAITYVGRKSDELTSRFLPDVTPPPEPKARPESVNKVAGFLRDAAIFGGACYVAVGEIFGYQFL